MLFLAVVVEGILVERCELTPNTLQVGLKVLNVEMDQDVELTRILKQ